MIVSSKVTVAEPVPGEPVPAPAFACAPSILVGQLIIVAFAFGIPIATMPKSKIATNEIA